MAMRACQKCLENNWRFEKIEEIIRATCVLCGHEVEFAAKNKSHNPNKLHVRAEYEIRNGKRFLKIDGKFVEVELCKVNSKGNRYVLGEFLRVMPV